MKKLFILIILAGVTYKGYTEFYQHKTLAFDGKGRARIMLFVHSGCDKPCASAERLLTRRGVGYETISVSDGEEQRARWEQLTPVRQMPYLVVGNERVAGYHKWEMIAALAVNFGSDYLTPSEEAIFRKNFTDEGKPKLVMYTVRGCRYCDLARRYFQQQSIRFEERNTSVDPGAKSELVRFEAGTPLIFYGYKRYVGWGEHVRREILHDLKHTCSTHWKCIT